MKHKPLPPCRYCGAEDVPFAPSRIKNKNWICNTCANEERDSDAARYVARKFSEYLRYRGEPRPYPGVEFVRKLAREANVDNKALKRMRLVLPSDGDIEGARLVKKGK